MDCKQEACPECTQRCLLVHRNMKHSVPNITSFFKVMIGDKFSEILFLPPKFACTVLALMDEKTHIEDLSGQRWEVTVSNLNGSLAFCQGWHAFAQDHHLEIGDFLIFHYGVGSHFIAQIYDRTGCEKPKCSENSQQKKITRSKRSPISKHYASQKIDTGLINEQVSSTSVLSGSEIEPTESQCDAVDVETVPMIMENTSNSEKSNGMLKSVSKAEYIEEPLFMLDRDLGFKQGAYESSIFDMSNFERQNNEFDAHGNKKIMAGDEKSPCHAGELIFRQTEEVVANEDTVAVGRKVVAEARKVVASNASDFETIEKNKDSNMMGKTVLRDNKDSCDDRMSGKFLASSEEHGENGKDSLDLGNAEIKKCQTAEKRSNIHSIDIKGIKKECAKMTSERHGQEEIGEIPEKASESMKGLHHHSSNPTDKVFKVVKTEEIEFISSSAPIAANLLCFAGNQSFLELPASLPSFSYRRGSKMERKVVLLRDPEARLWPVLYHEKPGLKVLTSGWEDFGRANNIQPGDECVFMLENEVEGIYVVRIVKKLDEA